MMMLMRIIHSWVNMQTLTFSWGAHFFPKLSYAYIFGTLFSSFLIPFKRLMVNYGDDRMIMLTYTSVSNFDNSYMNNCLSVRQTNDCSRMENLGHLLRKPTAQIFSQTFIPLPLSHWNMTSETMYIPGGPIDMTKKKHTLLRWYF